LDTYEEDGLDIERRREATESKNLIEILDDLFCQKNNHWRLKCLFQGATMAKQELLSKSLGSTSMYCNVYQMTWVRPRIG
jgi:hypothetical protein